MTAFLTKICIQWRNDRIQKLYTIRGDEILNPAQIFSECDVFVAVPVGGR